MIKLVDVVESKTNEQINICIRLPYSCSDLTGYICNVVCLMTEFRQIF